MIAPSLALPEKKSTGLPVVASEWNAVIDAARALRPHVEVTPQLPRRRHPWRASLNQGERLQIRIAAGCVNDEPATIPWRVEGDARGPLPEASREAWRVLRDAAPQDPFLAEWYDRPLYEADAPFLEMDMDTAAVGSQWVRLERAPAGIELAAGEELYRSAVVLAAFPFQLLGTRPFPRRFRVYAGRGNPAQIRQARVGELLELARIYQVLSGGELSRVWVDQRVFWNLGCLPVEPTVGEISNPLPLPSFGGIGLGLLDGIAAGINLGNQLIVDQANAALAQMGWGTQSTEFWTA
jgi:hypothetical protein